MQNNNKPRQRIKSVKRVRPRTSPLTDENKHLLDDRTVNDLRSSGSFAFVFIGMRLFETLHRYKILENPILRPIDQWFNDFLFVPSNFFLVKVLASGISLYRNGNPDNFITRHPFLHSLFWFGLGAGYEILQYAYRDTRPGYDPKDFIALSAGLAVALILNKPPEQMQKNTEPNKPK